MSLQRVRTWALNVLLAIDKLGNVLFFPGGKSDETISAHAATARKDGKWWGCQLCRFLDWLEPHHCDKAVKNDRRRAEDSISDLDHYYDQAGNRLPRS